MKTSRFVSVVMVLAAVTLVGCGKKDKKSSGIAGCNTYVNGQYVSCSNYTGGSTQIVDTAAIQAKQVELAGIFNNKAESAGTLNGMGVVFQRGGYSSSQARLFGINLGFNIDSYATKCDYIKVMAKDSPAAGNLQLAKLTNANCGQQYPTLGTTTQYLKADNTELANALNALASNIYTRGVYLSSAGFNGTYQAYSILVPSTFNPSVYAEYVVAPDLPTFMNPIAFYDQSTGEFKMLQGAQFL